MDTMVEAPLISVIIIFLNAQDYLQEAIESVLAQTYTHWELLLVDDGSSDDSTAIAQHYADQKPEKVYYLDHPGHQNRGMSPSRNLGIDHARGDYIAFLDADDVWLSQKLAEQAAILVAHPDTDVLYGRSLYWYSWQDGVDGTRSDFAPTLGVQPDALLDPPVLLPLYLRGKASVPCPTSIIIRSSLIAQVGGFVEAFGSRVYEDQAFYAKVCLKAHTRTIDKCWDLYRQHAHASTAVALRTGAEYTERSFFLNWLSGYLTAQGVTHPEVWAALHKEMWRMRYPGAPEHRRFGAWVRWAKKWLLRVEERVLPSSIDQRLWSDQHGA